MSKIKEILKSIDWMNIPASVYTRYILMIITILNMILIRLGVNPIPGSEESVYQTVSDILTAIVFIVNTWKNNSVTSGALAADEYMKQIKEEKNND